QLQDTAIDFAAALSRFLDAQQKHESIKNGITRFDGDALFNVISESLHNQMPCSIVDLILRKLEERSMDNADKLRSSLTNYPKTDDFLRMYSRDVNMENGSRKKYQGESQRTYLEIHANENRVKLVLPTANRQPSFANTFETRQNGWKQAYQALRTDCRRSSKHCRGVHHARHKTFASQSELGNGKLPAPHQAEGFFGCDYANRKKRTNFNNNSKNGAIAARPSQLCSDIELSDESICSLQNLNESSVKTMETEEKSENGRKEMIHQCYLNQSHATCRNPTVDRTDQPSQKHDNLKTERSEQIPVSRTEAKTVFDKEATTTFLATHHIGGVFNRKHSQQSVRTKDIKKSKRTRARNTWSPKSSGDEISHCLTLLRSPEWDKQLEGLKRVQALLQLEPSGGFDRLFKNEEELRTFTSALLSASRNLRSQVSRAAINTIQAFGNLLISNGRGFLWDSQADKILHAILARIGGDTSTKFLLNDASKALEVVVSCLTPARAIVTLAKQVYEQKVKSANSRLAVATQLDRLIVKARNTSSLPRQLGSDGLQRLLKVSAQFLVDGILNIRICGQNILTVLLNKFNLEETCRRTLSEPQWRNAEKLIVPRKTNVR
ncbi:TOG array regulator of axonemal microtubules protein 1, partial [Clonorchis sinensis]